MVITMFQPRPRTQEHLRKALSRSRIVAILGPRQCGKTTLARQWLPAGHPAYFDLEDPVTLVRLGEPMTALAGLEGLVVIDEIQRAPHLFPVLRVLADRDPLPARFLILGSASPALAKGASESLAGRVEWIGMEGFHLPDTGLANPSRHWVRGGYPLSYLADSDEDSFVWRRNLVRTFLERDLPGLFPRIPTGTFYRFWSMVAHYHGQVWKRGRARPLPGRQRADGAPVPGSARGDVPAADPAALACQCRQAPGQGAQGVLPGLGPAATSSWASRPPGTWSATPRSAPPGKAMWSRKPWPRPNRTRPTSGPPTGERSWTSW